MGKYRATCETRGTTSSLGSYGFLESKQWFWRCWEGECKVDVVESEAYNLWSAMWTHVYDMMGLKPWFVLLWWFMLEEMRKRPFQFQCLLRLEHEVAPCENPQVLDNHLFSQHCSGFAIFFWRVLVCWRSDCATKKFLSLLLRGTVFSEHFGICNMFVERLSPV